MLSVIVFIAILVFAIWLTGFLRPNQFSLSRSLEMRATPEKVFAQLNDFNNWKAWSPWEKMDPAMQRTLAGAASGKGAKYSWIGNKKVGEGNMEITRAVAPSQVMLNLNFLKPFKASNVTEFKLTPKVGGTRVDWEMRGPSSVMMRIMHAVMDMDAMVGKDFEQGLRNLKSVVER
jgi:Polyketide cyclase / dehydrase and lipid transport